MKIASFFFVLIVLCLVSSCVVTTKVTGINKTDAGIEQPTEINKTNVTPTTNLNEENTTQSETEINKTNVTTTIPSTPPSTKVYDETYNRKEVLTNYTCFDDDGGDNPYLIGKVYLKGNGTGTTEVFEDNCSSENTLVENFCRGDKHIQIKYPCNYMDGYHCHNGQCDTGKDSIFLYPNKVVNKDGIKIWLLNTDVNSDKKECVVGLNSIKKVFWQNMKKEYTVNNEQYMIEVVDIIDIYYPMENAQDFCIVNINKLA